MAVDRMASNRVRHLPVVDSEGRMIGVLSDRDIRPITEKRALEERLVEEVMTRSVIALPPEATREMLIAAFTQHYLSAIPIVDQERRPVGVVSYLDLLRT